jgi:hypothetical protein
VVACIGFTEGEINEWMNIETRMYATQYNTMYSLINVTKFLLQSSFRDPIGLYYYIWIAVCVLAVMWFKTFDDQVLYYELVFYVLVTMTMNN